MYSCCACQHRLCDSLRVGTISYARAVLVPGSGGCCVYAICTPHGCICELPLALRVCVLRRCTLVCVPRRRDALLLCALSPLLCANAMPDSFTCRYQFAPVYETSSFFAPEAPTSSNTSHAPHVHPWLRFNSTRSTLEAVAALWRASY
jgi:hypothetical protein